MERQNGERIVHVVFHVRPASELVEARAVNAQLRRQIHRVKRAVVPPDDGLVDLLEADAADTAGGVGEILVDHVARDAHSLKNLCALIRLDGRDAHLRRDAHHAVENRLVIRVHRGVIVLIERSVLYQLTDALLRQIRVDGAGAEAEERGKMVHVARLGAFQNERNGRMLFRLDQILLQARHGQQRRNGDVVFIHAAVGQDDDIRARAECLVAGNEQPVERQRQRRILVVEQRQLGRFQPRHAERLNLHQVAACEHGVIDLQNAAVLGQVLQEIAVGADVDGRVGHNLFAQRVDGRICDLREHLLEVIEQRLVLFRQHRQRDIRAHRRRWLDSVLRHGQN